MQKILGKDGKGQRRPHKRAYGSYQETSLTSVCLKTSSTIF